MAKKEKKKAKTFLLNEQHELERGEKEQRGGMPKYDVIDWAAKGKRIHTSLRGVKGQIDRSADPVRENHYFLLARQETDLYKLSESQYKPDRYREEVDYAGADSQVFERLGLDLIQVNEDGSASVHAEPGQMERILATSDKMDLFNLREKVRWAKVREFDLIDWKYRLDFEWLARFARTDIIDIIIELQPLLLEREIGRVIKAIGEKVGQEERCVIKGGGRDYSGRQWFRGMLTRGCIEDVAQSFYSIQSMHSPQMSIAAEGRARDGMSGRVAIASTQGGHVGPRKLPCVAILDTGIPEDHLQLREYARGRYVDPGSINVRSGHGSFVASRIVFGDRDAEELERGVEGNCCFYDARISWNSEGGIHDKSVIEAMTAIVRTRPDVRVFNLSFDSQRPLEEAYVEISERLRTVQDLDNFIFANDVVVAICAGNTQRGIQPNKLYPNHYNDLRWQLAHWGRSFNAMTCGSFVDVTSIGDGLVRNARWPSPFTRVGPGLCGSPKPDFSAHGGNNSKDYQHANGLGVWGYNERGFVEDRSGTSFAVPLLSREAAIVLETLERYCPVGAIPYGATAKAFLALTAIPPVNHAAVKELAKVALGKGQAQAERLARARASSAVLLWQGALENSRDKARVRIPMPKAWIEEAERPFLRLVLAWDSPVNAEVRGVWACRKVEAQLRLHPEGSALRPKGKSHKSYPLVERKYDLKDLPEGVQVEGDEWLLELSYRDIAAAPSSIEVSPKQRVAFAAELIDYGSRGVSPQKFMLDLPITETMNRLSVGPAVIKSPIMIRPRV